MTIYIDIILLENICMNYIIIFATAYIMKIKIRYFKILVSSIIGAIYAILIYLNLLPIYSNILMKFFLSVIMTYVAYDPRSIKTAIKQLVVFYLVSFAFGGSAFALIYFLRPENILMKNGVYIGTYPIKAATAGAIVGFAVLTISLGVIKKRTIRKGETYRIIIKFNKEEIETIALLDTGNMLKDPITQMPVIIIEKNKLYNFLPNCILDNIDRIIGGDAEIVDNEEIKEYISKFRFIPYNSLGRKNGMILGIKPEEVIIDFDGEEKTIQNVIIGIYNQRFNNNRYNALIGLEILEKVNH